MSVFVHAQGIKSLGGKKWQNSVHVVVECPHTRRSSLSIHSYSVCFLSKKNPGAIEQNSFFFNKMNGHFAESVKA